MNRFLQNWALEIFALALLLTFGLLGHYTLLVGAH